MDNLIILQDSSIIRQKKYLELIGLEKESYPFLRFVNQINDVVEIISSETPKAILIHVSDVKNNPSSENEIIKKCAENKIDLVYFTGSQNRKSLKMNQYPTASLSANDLYSPNLHHFLKNATTNYRLGYLVFGKNFVLSQLLNFRMYLNINLKNDNKKDRIYSAIGKKVDIDELLKILDLPSGVENFQNINMEELSHKINIKINNIVQYGEVVE